VAEVWVPELPGVPAFDTDAAGVVDYEFRDVSAQGREVLTRYIFRWDRPGLPGRKGQVCVVLVRGKMNSCAVEFEDGYRAVVSRNALRKVKDAG
jgi:hypothetical protein